MGATQQAASAIRVAPIAMAIGQACGRFAAVRVEWNVVPSELSYFAGRKILIWDGAYLPERG